MYNTEHWLETAIPLMAWCILMLYGLMYILTLLDVLTLYGLGNMLDIPTENPVKCGFDGIEI